MLQSHVLDQRYVRCAFAFFYFSTIWLKILTDCQRVQALSIPSIRHASRLKPLSLSLCAKKRRKARNSVDESMQEEDQYTYIRFSRAFQRHVVYVCTHSRKRKAQTVHHDFHCDRALESFLFLDEAMAKYPDAKLAKLLDVGVENDQDNFEILLAGMGLVPSASMLNEKGDRKSNGIEALRYLASMALGSQRLRLPPTGSETLNKMRDSFVHKLGREVSPKRFESHSPESIHHNYGQVIDLLTRGRPQKVHAVEEGRKTKGTAGRVDGLLMKLTRSGLAFSEAGARAVIANFPQLCLYDIHELEERIRFMISPQQPSSEMEGKTKRVKKGDIDYYHMLRKGFGAGFTVEQATQAVKAVPQFLSIHHEDSKKPPMLHFYRDLKVEPHRVEQARIELANLIGSDGCDMLAFAYLNSLGLSWEQIRLFLDAFPALAHCDTEPGWDLLDNGPLRNELDAGTMNFLRKRLQIDNSDVHAMIKTHSRISTYAVKNNLLPTLNAIQSRLMLSTRDLQRVVLRMPSVTGMGVDSSKRTSALDEVIEFYLNEACLSPNDLRKAVVKQPSLLQYSVATNLRPKLHYLTDELGIDKSSVARIISSAPAAMGLSLQHNLRPKAATIRNRCNLTKDEFAILITTVPSILLFSLKKKIEACFTFLTVELELSPDELGSIILRSPRILSHGVDTSLSPKIKMLKDALVNEGRSNDVNGDAIMIIKKNPALLATTNAILQSRIKKYLDDIDTTLSEALKPRAVGRKKMVKFVRTVANKNRAKKSEENEGTMENKGPHSSPSFIDVKSVPFTLYDVKSDSISIAAFASGSIYPSDDINLVRGRRKAGGIAIEVPQVSNNILDSKFEEATRMSFGMITPQEEVGTSPQDGLVLAGFPFLRPSRNRCDIYSCHGALKVILQLLKQAAEERDMRNTNVSIEIYTDSSYAWNLLKDSDSLLECGSYPSQAEALFEVNGPLALANPDLLFPLTKTMHRMSNDAVINRRRNKRLCIGKEVKISFRFVGDLRYDDVNAVRIRDLNSLAKRAAEWQYKKG